MKVNVYKNFVNDKNILPIHPAEKRMMYHYQIGERHLYCKTCNKRKKSDPFQCDAW